MENKKSVLMFCPKFFGYEKRLSNAISDEGYLVDLYDERPNNGFFCKTFLRLNFKPYKAVVRKYIKKIIDKNADKQYDYVLVVKSEAAGEKELKLLREAYPNARFILYLWDSVANVPDGEKKLSLYDKVLTFDPADAEVYGITLRPLFFGKEYELKLEPKMHYKYDIAFVGTAHTIRPRIIKQLEVQCKRQGKDCFSYMFLPHPIVYFYNKLINPAYRNIRKKDIRFEALSSSEINKIYEHSRSILDVEHISQRGLTIRTIEMIGSQKKLVTTNKNIEKYDFYNKNNICIIDKDNPVLREGFLQTPYEPINNEVLKRYSIRYFVREIFDIKE